MTVITTFCAVLTVVLQYLATPAEDRARARKVIVALVAGGAVFVVTLAIRTAYRGPSLHALVRVTQVVLLLGALRIARAAARPAPSGRHAAVERGSRGSRTLRVFAAVPLLVAAVGVPPVARYVAFASCDTHAFPEAAGKKLRDNPVKNYPLDPDYVGRPVSVVITPQRARASIDHAVLLRWGEWRYCVVLRVPGSGVAFHTLKTRRDGPPLRVGVWPPADVRVVEAPVTGAIDINMDWVSWPEWLVV